MIVGCINNGTVKSDYCTGGIVGIIQTMISIDRESVPDSSVSDIVFSDTTEYIRATVFNCTNNADISAKYDYCGGIAGFGETGAIMNGKNSRNVSAANYAGGIAGSFSGTIEQCCFIGIIDGETYVGGISGSVNNISECRAIVQIKANLHGGAIAGEVTGSAEANLFVNNEYGGIDDISYSGKAEPTDHDNIVDDSNRELFNSLTVTFVSDNKVILEISVEYGNDIAELPTVDDKQGQYWTWENFDNKHILCNLTVSGTWNNYIRTIGTSEETPVFLA